MSGGVEKTDAGVDGYGTVHLYPTKEPHGLPSTRCLNVAVAGSVVLYDRLAKGVRNGGT